MLNFNLYVLYIMMFRSIFEYTFKYTTLDVLLSEPLKTVLNEMEGNLK